MSTPTPSWLTEPCPPWCSRAHTPLDHPDDRAHTSEPITIPTVERIPMASADGIRYRQDALTLQVGLHRLIGAHDTWVYIGDGFERGIEVPPLAARQLADALCRVLGG